MIIDMVIDDCMIIEVCEKLGLDRREVMDFLELGYLVMEEDLLEKMLREMVNSS